MNNWVSPIKGRSVLDPQRHGCSTASVSWVWGEEALTPGPNRVFLSSWTSALHCQCSFGLSAVKRTKSFLEAILLCEHHKEVSRIGCIPLPPIQKVRWSGKRQSTRYSHAPATLSCRVSSWGNIQTLQVYLHNCDGIPSRNERIGSIEPAHISRKVDLNHILMIQALYIALYNCTALRWLYPSANWRQYTSSECR